MRIEGCALNKRIDLSSLVRGGEKFQQQVFDAVRRTAGEYNGEALGVVHPCFYYGFREEHPEEAFENENQHMSGPVSRHLGPNDYPDFLGRLANEMATTDRPIFVFLDERNFAGWPHAKAFLDNILPKNFIIPIMTRSGNSDGYPQILFNGRPDARLVGTTLMQLGFTSIFLAGEFAWHLVNEDMGCVYGIAEQLQMFTTVNVWRQLTFPNRWYGAL